MESNDDISYGSKSVETNYFFILCVIGKAFTALLVTSCLLTVSFLSVAWDNCNIFFDLKCVFLLARTRTGFWLENTLSSSQARFLSSNHYW